MLFHRKRSLVGRLRKALERHRTVLSEFSVSGLTPPLRHDISNLVEELLQVQLELWEAVAAGRPGLRRFACPLDEIVRQWLDICRQLGLDAGHSRATRLSDESAA